MWRLQQNRFQSTELPLFPQRWQSSRLDPQSSTLSINNERMSEYQTEMSSFIILQLKVNNKEKVDKHPSTDNSNNLFKESQKKKNPWSAVINSDMGLYCSEYHTIISVSQSTLTRSHTHSNYTPAHRYKCTHTHTPWTIKADRRDYNRTAAPDKSIL